MGACASEEQGEGIRESVDQSYLESNQYQVFEKRVQQEQQRAVTQKGQFVAVIADQIAEYRGTKITLPTVIDEAYIQNILKKKQNVPPTVVQVFGSRHRYYSLATVEAENMQYYLFMLCKIVGYDNCSIWFATSKNDTLIDVATIAGYYRSVSYEESSRIRLNENQVHVETVKQVKNPFEQTNRLTYQYEILPSGKINQINS